MDETEFTEANKREKALQLSMLALLTHQLCSTMQKELASGRAIELSDPRYIPYLGVAAAGESPYERWKQFNKVRRELRRKAIQAIVDAGMIKEKDAKNSGWEPLEC